MTPRQLLWDWLKAERRHQDLERRRERQAGLTELQLQQRRRGKPEPPQRINRAARRAFNRRLKKIA